VFNTETFNGTTGDGTGNGNGSGPSDNSSSSTSVGPIVGGVVGGVAVLALVGFGVWFMMRRKKQRAGAATHEASPLAAEGPAGGAASHLPSQYAPSSAGWTGNYADMSSQEREKWGASPAVLEAPADHARHELSSVRPNVELPAQNSYTAELAGDYNYSNGGTQHQPYHDSSQGYSQGQHH